MLELTLLHKVRQHFKVFAGWELGACGVHRKGRQDSREVVEQGGTVLGGTLFQHLCNEIGLFHASVVFSNNIKGKQGKRETDYMEAELAAPD